MRHAVIAALKRTSLEPLATQMESESSSHGHDSHPPPAASEPQENDANPLPASSIQRDWISQQEDHLQNARQLHQDVSDHIASMTPNLMSLGQDLQWVQEAVMHTHALVQCQNMSYSPQQFGAHLQSASDCRSGAAVANSGDTARQKNAPLGNKLPSRCVQAHG